MASAPPRRNDPCPCGSGRRFKECHGRLDAQDPAGIEALAASALQHHQQGRIDEAERGYREILDREPGNAIATHYLGMAAWARGNPVEAERLLRASLAANDTIADFHNNLALLLRDTGRLEAAIAGFERTLEVDPAWFEAHNNLGLAFEAARRFDAAEAQYRLALAREPRFAAAQQNLARLLLALGRFGEGWERYRWRLLAQGLTREIPAAGATRLPASLAGRSIALMTEQGLGDVLFFLRFAPALARRGAQLAFRGDARLHSMLERTGLFALGCEGETADTQGLERIFVGELPWLLEAHDPRAFPLPLVLAAHGMRVDELRHRFASAARLPLVAITWRSGVPSAGPARTQVKEVPIAALGAALRGLRARWVSVQRAPNAGEREALESALGAPVQDLSAINGDLEEALAVFSVVDHYVGTSNTNTYLRAGLGRAQQVVVPDPPEWRWMTEGGGSPWFPGMRIYRPASGGWNDSLVALRRDLEVAIG